MNGPAQGSSELQPPAVADEEMELRCAIESAEPRNLLVLALYDIFFRIAWIFKTESVIVPAFLDELTGGAGGMRGWLPTLSRLSQSVPPLFAADAFRDAPRKGPILRTTSWLMSLPPAVIAWMAWRADRGDDAALAIAFLVMYLLFFAATGLNQVAQGTLHGKLIRAERRGRLMRLSGVVGPLLAIIAAAALLGPWLNRPGTARFMPIFAFSAVGFVLCGGVTFALREPVEKAPDTSGASPWEQVRLAWYVYRGDSQFRRAARVVMLLTTIVLVFPHFQWLAREQMHLQDHELMVWVIAQNIGVACFSPFCGWLADRRGNRIVLRVQCLVLAAAPLVALAIAGNVASSSPWRSSYAVVFVMLGMSPVTMRTINNYTLELVEPELHPLYLSTMRLCFLAPFLISPAAGAMLDAFGDRPYTGACWLFGSVSGLIGLAGLLTFRMAEPRDAKGAAAGQG